MVELKSIKGHTFPLRNLKQYGKLARIRPQQGLHKLVIIWFRDHDKIIAVNIDEITKMLNDGKKSINITTLDQSGYQFEVIPSRKKRIFLVGDYSSIFNSSMKQE